MKLRTIGYGFIIAVTAVAFAIGSATTGEAKGRKKAAAAPPSPPPVWCPFGQEQPVCATKGKQKITYATACFAAKDGAKVISNKACPTKAAKVGKAKKGGKKKAAKNKKM